MEWTQVLTILVGNIGMILWSTRQARTDFLHLDRKLEENRKETNQIVKAIQEEIKDFHLKLALQDQEFKMRFCAIEERNKK
jgi:hypothetical protein